jgi:hypothetical protein
MDRLTKERKPGGAKSHARSGEHVERVWPVGRGGGAK